MPSAWIFYEAWEKGISLAQQLDDIWAKLHPALASAQPEIKSSPSDPKLGQELRNQRNAREEQISRSIDHLFQMAQSEKIVLLGYRDPKPRGDGPIRIDCEALLEEFNWKSGHLKFGGRKFSHVRVVDFYEYSSAMLFDPHTSWDPDSAFAPPPDPAPEPKIEFRSGSPFMIRTGGAVARPQKTGRPSERDKIISALERLDREGQIILSDGPTKNKFDLVRETIWAMNPSLDGKFTGLGNSTISKTWRQLIRDKG